MAIIPSTVTNNIGRQILLLKKNSPHIYMAAGITGVVTSAVMACKATLKLDKVLNEFKEDIESVKELRTSNSIESVYPLSENNRDMAYVYGRGSYKLFRLYGPSVILGGASICMITTSHIVLTRRNNALTATVVLLSKAYEDYRERVREELGKDKEFEVFHNIKQEKVTDGKKEIVKAIADPNQWSPYARFFDEYCPEWRKSPEENRLFLQCQQNYLNNLLQSRGHVFLNEVYDQLGIERSQAGQVVGWVLSKDGDNFIDFGIFDIWNRNFVNGNETSILLDFNVDGVVFDKI
jgi:hypothetical protein